MPRVIKGKQPLVRIDFADKIILDELTTKTGESAPRLLHRAVTSLKKEIFFEQMNAGYKDLRNAPQAWATEMAERSLFDKTTGDGLDF